jgi:hypothetical protein
MGAVLIIPAALTEPDIFKVASVFAVIKHLFRPTPVFWHTKSVRIDVVEPRCHITTPMEGCVRGV